MSFFKKIQEKIKNIFTKSNNIEEIEDILIEADFGYELSNKIAKELKKSQNIKEDFEKIINETLTPYIENLKEKITTKTIFLIVGVNGTGKTTTIAKLANFFQNMGKTVGIAACDTFRAAAVNQIELWAKKLNCQLFKSEENRDPASVVYDALNNSKNDILIIDTAGRMHNNKNLMLELNKIANIVKKLNLEDICKTIITIDATSGQNVFEQIKTFKEYCNINGIILTKVDGNAKGGTILKIINEFKIPIYGVGTGEKYEDFEMFDIKKFCNIW